MAEPVAVAVVGTDTGVGKTRVTLGLVTGLRALSRRCWVHKPVACGGWDGRSAEDGRALAAISGDGQPPGSIAPRQYPEACSPHLAMLAAGVSASLDDLLARVDAVRGDHDLVVEGAGGLLAPLTSARETIADLLVRARLPALVVTRPDLGTLSHTALTVAHARARGIALLGLVLNRPSRDPLSLATRTARDELAAITGLPVLADLPHATHVEPMAARALAAATLDAALRQRTGARDAR